ncbi:unnamed protein product [Rotaria socialis]|uniref:Peptidase S9 prolyl oligopeptidase catalytic domain-containing protein n=1 Tax=Rotaria socialis TaxID=392032 RepID=A0A820T7D1_9BILA|nr:unnamed protein product [Rotaria socialis]
MDPKFFFFAGFFLLGAVIVLIPCVVVIGLRSNCPDKTTDSPATSLTASLATTPAATTPATLTTTTATIWNESDYQSNSQYYQSLTNTHYFNQTDNLRLDRLSSPQLHPTDGRSLIYLRRQYHMPDLRGSTTTLHWQDLQTNKNVQLTRPIWGKQDQQFTWIDKNTILFLSNRASSDLTQIFQLTLPDDLSTLSGFIEPTQITNYSLNIDNLLVNRNATRLAFSCQVYANLNIEQTNARKQAELDSGRTIYKFDKLYIRHWDEYYTGLRNHPFVVSINRQTNGIFQLSSNPVDVLFNIDSDSPTKPFGDAKAQWSFSASGNSFAFTRQHDEDSSVAWTTNLDIYTVDLRTAGQPTVSSLNTKVTLLDDWDRSIQAMTWSPNGQSLYLEIGEEASNVIYYLVNIYTNHSVDLLIDNGTSHNIHPHPTQERTFVFTYDTLLQPLNIYLYSLDSSIQPLTNHNTALLSKVILSKEAQKFSFMGANNETVWGWHVPPAHGTGQPAPLAFLIHGGPQSSWYDAWSYRWNLQSFSAEGYAVIAINFHGSDSYGQNFTDSITGEYGSLPYEDLKLGLDYALRNFSYIDRTRVVALGASYGGYMINWIAGQPEMSSRFKTLVCHNGLFDMRSMGYSTEELFFSEHDAGNYTVYDNPSAYEVYNPVNHVANWTLPMLIIVGAHDYRVPETQGIGAFTALQRRNITSRLLYFPTENHWVLNPQHSIAWFDEVFNWMRQHAS